MYKDHQYNLKFYDLQILFHFLNHPHLIISLSFTTIALSKLPPLAKPFFLIFSISSNKQKVLELKISLNHLHKH